MILKFIFILLIGCYAALPMPEPKVERVKRNDYVGVTQKIDENPPVRMEKSTNSQVEIMSSTTSDASGLRAKRQNDEGEVTYSTMTDGDETIADIDVITPPPETTRRIVKANVTTKPTSKTIPTTKSGTSTTKKSAATTPKTTPKPAVAANGKIQTTVAKAGSIYFPTDKVGR